MKITLRGSADQDIPPFGDFDPGFPKHTPHPCSIKQLVSWSLLDGAERAEIRHDFGKKCSGNEDPLFLNRFPHELHQVCGLTIQHIANLLQCIHGQVFHRTNADCGHRGRADACPFRKFLLGHSTHGKHHFDLELYHNLSLLPSGHCITHFVVNQYAKRKIISYFVKEITQNVLTNYEFRSTIKEQ